jgi:FemAB-related protein (PEP-CTERM system-associated)
LLREKTQPKEFELNSTNSNGRAEMLVTDAVTIRLMRPEDASAWDEFVTSHSSATTYHLSEWRNVIGKAFGHECYYWIAIRSTGVVGILPLVRLRSRLFGDFMVSMPFLNFGGAVAVDEEVERELVDAGCQHARTLGVSHIEFRDIKLRDNWSNVRTDKVTMRLPLPTTVEQLWQDLRSERRNRIKRSSNQGASTQVGSLELLDEFYSVFARNMRDLGTPVYGKEFFASILRHFPDRTVLLVTRYQGRPVAAAFLVHHRDSIEIPWVSSVRDFNHLSFNVLLYWECLQYAVRAQKRYFDFGRSTVGSGTYAFKQRWGAKDTQLYWHYWLNQGKQMPNLTPHNPKYQVAVKVWQRLPLLITKVVGPHIVRNLP